MALYADTPIQYLKGVGPKLGDVLEKRGVSTIGELLHWYPRSYEDRRAARSVASLQPGEQVSLLASVLNVRSIPMGRSRRKMYEVMVGDSSGRISCKFFRVPYKGYFQRFQNFEKVRVSGKVLLYRGRIEFHHPEIQAYNAEEEQKEEDRLLPLYTETEGLRPGKIRQIIASALDGLEIPDPLPDWVRDKYQLLEKNRAITEVHKPASDQGEAFLNFQAPAQKRVIFDEFFWLELHLALRRSGIAREEGRALPRPSSRLQDFTGSLPFELTGAQQKVLQEILGDLKQPHPMHRLVQGDVGSGKTVVALMAAIHAADNGVQSAIMVPTEILAEQHFKNSKKLLETLGLKVTLLTGQMKGSEKGRILHDIKTGQVDLVVGTHALIQEWVEFSDLGLVIIDEQHRFGVDQRNRLKGKGQSPHFLVMTATPIPRTLAMTVYGDLDVSVIDELPKGRQPIVTRKVFDSKRAKVMGFLRDQIAKGRQAYVVYPLVEESDKIELKNAVDEFERLQKELPKYRLGLLHGKMKPAEKEQIMRRFRDHELDVLVSTTVIEVGVDVPNANLMIIEHAERFGLSQLHQLRGRVGRGEHKSYCVLMLGYAVSEEGKERAAVMESTNDGFKIAEADLELRGPGEFMGTRQSGLSGFRMANLVRDSQILQLARQAAFEIIAKDPSLEQNPDLKEALEKATSDVIG